MNTPIPSFLTWLPLAMLTTAIVAGFVACRVRQWARSVEDRSDEAMRGQR